MKTAASHYVHSCMQFCLALIHIQHKLPTSRTLQRFLLPPAIEEMVYSHLEEPLCAHYRRGPGGRQAGRNKLRCCSTCLRLPDRKRDGVRLRAGYRARSNSSTRASYRYRDVCLIGMEGSRWKCGQREMRWKGEVSQVVARLTSILPAPRDLALRRALSAVGG